MIDDYQYIIKWLDNKGDEHATAINKPDVGVALSVFMLDHPTIGINSVTSIAKHYFDGDSYTID